MTGDRRVPVVLALGGNIGNKAATLGRAARALRNQPDIAVTAVSRLYRTVPWAGRSGLVRQRLRPPLTSWAPEALLARVNALEVELGRVDMSAGGHASSTSTSSPMASFAKTERLTLPHPDCSTGLSFLRAARQITADLHDQRRPGGRGGPRPRSRSRPQHQFHYDWQTQSASSPLASPVPKPRLTFPRKPIFPRRSSALKPMHRTQEPWLLPRENLSLFSTADRSRRQQVI